MLRVVAGRFRGRRLRSIRAPALRPTADRVREALFDILGGLLEGAPVVDLYAGTGALGIEALSRGAARVTWVERDPRLAALIRANLASLGVQAESEAARVLRADAGRFLSRLPPDPRRILLADPPYAVGAPAVLGWLGAHPAGYAAAALEHPAGERPGEELAESARVDRRVYGKVGLTVFTPLAGGEVGRRRELERQRVPAPRPAARVLSPTAVEALFVPPRPDPPARRMRSSRSGGAARFKGKQSLAARTTRRPGVRSVSRAGAANAARELRPDILISGGKDRRCARPSIPAPSTPSRWATWTSSAARAGWWTV